MGFELAFNYWKIRPRIVLDCNCRNHDHHHQISLLTAVRCSHVHVVVIHNNHKIKYNKNKIKIRCKKKFVSEKVRRSPMHLWYDLCCAFAVRNLLWHRRSCCSRFDSSSRSGRSVQDAVWSEFRQTENSICVCDQWLWIGACQGTTSSSMVEVRGSPVRY